MTRAEIRRKAKEELTAKEISIIQFASDGLTYKEISAKFGFGKRWAENVAQGLIKEFKVENITQLVAAFLDSGLINYNKKNAKQRKEECEQTTSDYGTEENIIVINE